MKYSKGISRVGYRKTWRIQFLADLPHLDFAMDEKRCHGAFLLFACCKRVGYRSGAVFLSS
jgi:hypothetical protein